MSNTIKSRPILLSTTNELEYSKQVNRKSNKHEKRCYFCETVSHYMSKCLALKKKSNRERWKWAEKKKVCLKCLNVDHNKSNCWGRNCNIEGCNKEHNRLLHYLKSTRRDNNVEEVEGDKTIDEKNKKEGGVNQEKGVL